MAALALIVASAASDRSDATAPSTVATVRGPVYAVAQDGARLAWRGCTEVVVRQPASGRKSRYPIPPFAGASPPCYGIPGRGLALARTRVVWTERTLGMKEYLAVVIATAPGVKPTRLGDLINDHGAAKTLVVSGQSVVYANGRTLWRVDALTGRQAVAATAGSAPISFSLEGRRLAWVETSRGVSRVRTVLLG